MKVLPFTLLLITSLSFAQGPLTVISKDGREVVLNEDGTWYFASDDIFLETEDGYTVRLKSNQNWEYIGNAPLHIDDRHRELDVDISLGEVFITEEVSNAGASKNSRRKTTLSFQIQISLAPNAETALNLSDLDTALFAVSDNRDKAYDISSIVSDTESLNPGKSAQVILKTDSAPSLLYSPKELYLDIDNAAFQTEQTIRLTQFYGAVERKRN